MDALATRLGQMRKEFAQWAIGVILMPKRFGTTKKQEEFIKIIDTVGIPKG